MKSAIFIPPHIQYLGARKGTVFVLDYLETTVAKYLTY